MSSARAEMLDRVTAYAAANGIGGKSLREIADGIGSSHRMLLYHFGTHEGLLAAIVEAVERQQRELMTELAARHESAQELMLALWERVSSPEVRPFVRLFFEVLGLAAQGAAGTDRLLSGLTEPWLDSGAALAPGVPREAVRVGVAVVRGLLLDLVAGADPADVDRAYRLFAGSFEDLTRNG
ncbi:MAG: TetR/AcrR family transcriptional regulator [Hamadaea sp.]|nr:TetR/AcrR family transcriptional regulator [Hamadaea sp.]NUT08502.1 TetR/AcrR family transcriptional regulator [Hamadaea sp.]